MNDETRYAEERSQGARRPLARVAGAVESWMKGSAAKFVDQSWRLVDVLADAIRAGQYDLGVPFIYSKALTLAAGTTDVLVLNVKKFGMISNMIPFVSNLNAVPNDVTFQAGIIRIQIGAQTFWEQQDGTILSPSMPGFSYSGFAPVVGGTEQPANHLGFLRRIPVAQGDVIQVDVRNTGVDDYQVGLIVTQYGALPPALGR